MSRALMAMGCVVGGFLLVGCGTRPVGSLGLGDASPSDADGSMSRVWDGPAKDGVPDRATASPNADATSPDISTIADAPDPDLPLALDSPKPDSSPAADAALADLSFAADGTTSDVPLPSVADASGPELSPGADARSLDLASITDLRAPDWPVAADAGKDVVLPGLDGEVADSPFRADEPAPDLPLADALPERQDVPGDTDPGCTRPSERPEALAQWEPPNQPGVRIASIAYSENMTYIFVGMTNGDVFHTSGGSPEAPSWSRIDEVGLPGHVSLPNLAVSNIVVSPKDSKSIWVSFFGGPEGFGHKVWMTPSGGQLWGELARSPGDSIWSLSLNPLDPDVLYTVTADDTATGDAGASEQIRRSSDRGETWYWWAPDERDPHTNGDITSAVGFDPNHAPSQGMRIWTGDRTGRIWVSNAPDPLSTDSVRTWATAGAGTPARTVNHLSVVVDGNGEHVAAAYRSLASDGIWLSDDGGQTWRNAHGACLPSTLIVYSVTINPRYPSTLYAFTSIGALRSDDSGSTWW